VSRPAGNGAWDKPAAPGTIVTPADPVRVIATTPVVVAPEVVGDGAAQRSASPYAGLATRTIAFAADAAVIDVVALLVGGIIALCLSLVHLPAGVRNVLLALGAVMAVAWSVSYFVLFWSTTGQTPGDRLMRIRVERAADGAVVSVPRSVVRLLGLALSMLLLCIPFLLILLDARRRALHDRLAGTVVRSGYGRQ
jgi:uncharacterized RDD family membrane protein YckC